MTPETISKLNDLLDDIRSLAGRVSRIADTPDQLAHWSDPTLPDQLRQLDTRIAQQRAELIPLLQQSSLEPDTPWDQLPFGQLADYAATARNLIIINQQLADERLRLAAAESPPSAKKPLYAQLSEIEQLALDPPQPLPEDLIAFIEQRHPVQANISSFVNDVQAQASPADSEDVLPREAPVDSDPFADSTPATSPVEAEPSAEVTEEPVEEAAVEAEIADGDIDDQSENIFDDAVYDAVYEAEQDPTGSGEGYALLETAAAAAAELDQPAPPAPTDTAEEPSEQDLIFDDFDDTPREKQILKAEDLSRQLESVNDDTHAESTASESDTGVSGAAETDEPLFDEDSVFDALEAAATSQPLAPTPAEAAAVPTVTAPLPEEQQEEPATEENETAAPASLELPPADYAGVREIAARAKEAQNRFDRVSYLSRLTWELVSVGEYAWAYQVSRCLHTNVDDDLAIPAPAPWLLKLLTLGDRVLLSSGRVAREFQSVISANRADALRIAENADKPEAFLLRAALMRGTITTASPVAADVLRTYLITPGQTQLYNYCSRIASFSSRASGLKLDQYFYRPGAASVETEARAIRSLAQAWQGSYFDEILSYRVATPVFSRAFWSVQSSAAATRPQLLKQWRARQIVKSHISRLLQPIVDNQLTRSAAMEEELARLSKNVTLEDDRTRVVVSDNEATLLPGKTIYNHVQGALELGSHWLVLAASYPGIESVLVPQEINELRDEIDRRQRPVFQELKGLERTHSSHAHRAAVTACRRNMDRIHQLFHPTEEPRFGEPDPQCLVNAQLLKIPGISLDDEWICHASPATLEQPLLQTLTGEPIAWKDAFESQLDAGSYRSARGLLRLEIWTDAERDQLRARMEEHRQDRASTLRELAERLKVQLEQSRHIEMITEREAKQYFDRIVALEQRIPADYRLNEIRAELIEIRQTLDTRRGLELRRMQQRMDRISDFDVHVQPMPPAAPPPGPDSGSASAADDEADPDSDRPDDRDDWALDV